MATNVNNKHSHIQKDNDHKYRRLSNPSATAPSLLLIHSVLILAQSLFGTGAVIGRLGLPSTNPVLFALIREGIAGPILCIIAFFKDKKLPSRSDWKLFILPGLCLFVNQLCFITGLKISSSITASAWQPSQGILAVLYGYCFGIERHFDRYKFGGILLGTSGAMFMVLYENADDSGNQDFLSTIMGSIMFFLNCSATVMYLILAKPLLDLYPSATVTGYSYVVASLSMVVAALIVANVPTLLDDVCPDCNGYAWDVPTVTIYALAYWIFAESIAAYLMMTWANQYTDPSINLAYTVLQPFTSFALAEIILVWGIVPKCDVDKSSSDNPNNCLYGASWNDLGAIGIAIGLYFVIYSSQRQKKREMEEAPFQRMNDNISSLAPAPDDFCEEDS